MSLGLNFAGITWGLPARWHPDEKADVVARMAREGSLHPGSFINPSLPLYLMVPPLWAQDRAAQAGLLPGPLGDPLFLGRFLSAVAGAGTVYLLGRLAADHMAIGANLGLLPPLLLALSPGFVNLCHFATPEAWLMLGTTAALLLALRHQEGRVPAWAVGLALGLCTSIKYSAAALLAPALVAVWLRPRSGPGRDGRGPVFVGGVLALALGLALAAGLDVTLAGVLRLKDARLLHPEHALGFVRGLERTALAGGAALLTLGLAARSGRAWAERLTRPEVVAVGVSAAVGFLAGTPYAALDPQAFLSDLAFDRQTQFEYKGLVGGSTSFIPYLRLLGGALSWPLLAVAGLGLLVGAGRAFRGDRAAAVLLTAALAPYLLVASSGHQAMRFLAPVFPPAAALAGLGLAALTAPPARRLVTGLVLARSAVGALLLLRLFYVDSRVHATRWMERNVPRGATVDVIANHAGYAPRVPDGRTLRVVPTLSREMAPPERFAEAAARYAAEAAPWLILTASYYERFLDHPGQRPERTAFFRDLLEGRGGFEVAARFRQPEWLRPPSEFLDPEIVILKKR